MAGGRPVRRHDVTAEVHSAAPHRHDIPSASARGGVRQQAQRRPQRPKHSQELE